MKSKFIFGKRKNGIDPSAKNLPHALLADLPDNFATEPALQAKHSENKNISDVSIPDAPLLLAENNAAAVTTGSDAMPAANTSSGPVITSEIPAQAASTAQPASEHKTSEAATGAGRWGWDTVGIVGVAAVAAVVVGKGGAVNVASSSNTLTGSVADGKIKSAKIYIDLNNNGKAEANEDTGIVSNDLGNYSGTTSLNPIGHTILAVGGSNIDTGLANTLVLKAPAGSTIVNPLTTLLQATMASNPKLTLAQAEAQLLTGLGFTLSGKQTLGSYDPLAVLATNSTDANALAAQKAAAQIVAIAVAAAAYDTTSATLSVAADNVMAAIAASVSSQTSKLDLGSNAVVTAILKTPTITLAAADKVVNGIVINTQAISVASDLAAVSAIQKTAGLPPSLGVALQADTGSSATDGVTKNSALTITNTQSKCVIEYSLDGGVTWNKSFTPAEGVNTVNVHQIDAGGNASAATGITFTLDTIAPAVVIASAATSKVSAPVVSGAAEVGATIRAVIAGATYSTTASDGTWSVSTASATPVSGKLALNLTGGNSVSVTATDTAGNTSAAVTQTLVLDAVVPSVPVFANVPGAANASAAKALAGAVTLKADSAAMVSVIFSNGKASVTKTLTGSGAPQTVALTQDDLTFLGDGAITVSSTASNASGNVSAAATTSFILDTVPPTVAITSAATSKLLAPVVSGTAETGATISAVIAGATYTVTASGGVWSINTASATPVSGKLALNTAGNNSIAVTATDAAGNASAAAVTQTLAIDAVVPAAPGLAVIFGAANSSAAKALAGAVTVSGESGATVAVTFSNGKASVTKTLTGTGAVQPVALTDADLKALGDGTIAVSATATNAAGNVSPAAAPTSFILDTVPPAVAITSPAATKVLTPVVSGTAEAGVTVAVTIAGATYSTTAGTGGTWSIDTASAQPASGTLALNATGSNSVSVTATDAVGNTSAPATQSLTLNVLLPAAPVVAITAGAANATAAKALAGAVTVNAETAATVSVVFSKSMASITKTLTGTGAAQVVTLTQADLTALGDGTITVNSTATDAAGYTSPAATFVSFVLDTIAPAAPVFAIATGAANASAAKALTGAVTVNAETGLPVTVTLTSSKASVTKTLTGTGAAQPVALTQADLTTLGDGPITVSSSTLTDLAGNVSPAAATTSFILDTVAPVVAITSAATSKLAAPVLSGTAEAGTTITVVIAGATYSTTATGGKWSIDTAAATPASGKLALNTAGSNSMTVTASDAAGNTSAAVTQSLTIDMLTPLAPVFSVVAGAANADAAKAMAGALTVTADLAATVSVVLSNGVHTVTKTLTGVGAAQPVILTQADLTALGDGTITANATSTSATYVSPAAVSASFVLDTVAPVAPVLAVVQGSSSATSVKAMAGAVTVAAELAAAVTVTLSKGAASVTKTLTGSGAAQPVTLAQTDLTALGDGTITVSSTAVDAAGNASPAAITASFILDTIPPAVAITSAATSKLATPTVSGTAEASSVITAVIGGATFTTTTAIGGTWIINTATAKPASGTLALNTAGINDIAVSATDFAGNTSAAVTQLLTIDALTPAAPVFTVASGAANATAAEAIAGAVSINADTGATVTVIFTKGATNITKTLTGTGAALAAPLTQADLTALGDGTITVNATSVTATGYASPAAAPASFILDTVTPITPVLAIVTGDANSTAAKAIAGAVTVTSEAGLPVTVTFANGAATVSKTLTGTGAAQTVTLTQAEVTTLGQGVVTVSSLTVTDVAGNVSAASTAPATTFTLDTIAPVAPVLAVVAGAANATAAQATTGAVTVNAENLSAVTVTFTNGTNTVNKTLTGTGAALAAPLTQADLATLGDGAITVSSTTTDVAGNVSPAATSVNFNLYTVSVALANVAAATPTAGGFVITGQAGDNSGVSISAAGDVNGDGYGDLIIGANGATTNTGKSYVVFGGASSTAAVNLTAVAAGTGGFVINGQAAGDNSGYSVAAAGDVNGDGLADMIVGAYGATVGANPTAGKSYVVFGTIATTAVNLATVAAGGVGAGGFVVNGQVAGDYSGYSVSSAGDVNGDGLADLIVGAYRANGTIGASYVVFGKTTTTAVDLATLGAGGFAINGQDATGYSGWSVSSVGDVNGDGLSDLIVSAYRANGAVGKSYLVFGKADNVAVNLSAIDPPPVGGVVTGAGGFVINGQAANDFSGYSVSAAGDVNGDGLADLIVGAYGASSGAGKSYVVFGKTATTAVDLNAVAAGTGGFVINGQTAGDWSGISVSAAGDVNGDGLADLIVGAGNATGNAGKSYVVYGKTDGAAVNLATVASGSGGFAIYGEAAGDHSGFSVSAAGDVNGDGLADLSVGAYGASTGAGKSYVIFGAASSSATVTGGGTTSVTGTAAAETLVGTSGPDTLRGNGGADVMYGGRGDDTFILNADNVAKLSAGATAGSKYARVDGGGGIDIVTLAGAGITLDLTTIANQGKSDDGSHSRISSIEKIDLGVSGNNTVKLTLADVLDMSEMNLFNSGNGWTGVLAAAEARHQVVITGDATDTVNLSGGVNWTNAGTVTNAGHTYNVYNHNTASGQLLIDQLLAYNAVA